MRRQLRSAFTTGLASLLLAAIAAACGSGSEGGFASPTTDAGNGSSSGSSGPGFGGSDASLGDAASPPIISDALVYLTSSPPAPIPTGAYCDKCVLLSSYAFTYSKPDGTFELPAYVEGDQYIVTQKGQFRRVRKIRVGKGSQKANAADTRLPGRNDEAAGDTIPRMKVMDANWDSIAKSLGKLGVTELTGRIGGPFDVDRTLSDLAEAEKYHIIFVPCAGDTNPLGPLQCSRLYAPSGTSKNTMRDYVERGGKLYVTDWSYEYVRQIWPGFIHFQGEDSRVGSACTINSYSGPAVWGDPKLDAWMQAIGEGSARLEKNYVSISSTASQPGLDEDGKSVTIVPKVWASTQSGGATKTATVSFQDKCGRVLYSTYHAEGTDNGAGSTLLAQEKALFHILLEVSACVGVKASPPR
jgi:hypothetical protein